MKIEDGQIISALDEGYISNEENDTVEEVLGLADVDNINDLLEANVSFNTRSLNVETILSSLVKGNFVIPPFQRRYVWKKEKVAYLALSIIKNIPIPPIYMYVDRMTKKQVVLDGQQRMIALFLYFNDLTYVRSDHHIDFKVVNDLNSRLRLHEEKKESLIKEGAKRAELREIEKEMQDLSKELLDVHGMKRCSYTVQTENPREGDGELDISYRKFDHNSREYILAKYMDITLVECNDLKPQKTYSNIFKLLNSAGKILGAQEIRNGIFWQTNLYKRLYNINESNQTWRTIYGKISVYSKDMEILLKVLALSYYSKVKSDAKGEHIEVDFSGFSWAKIMEEYSSLAIEKDLNEEIDRLEKYLERICLVNNKELKCRKAVFEAVFVAMCFVVPEMDKDIEYEWLCNVGELFGSILSSKMSVEERLTIAYNAVKEKYYD